MVGDGVGETSGGGVRKKVKERGEGTCQIDGRGEKRVRKRKSETRNIEHSGLTRTTQTYLSNSLLIYSNRSQDAQRTRVDLGSAVGDDADYGLEEEALV